MKSVVTTEQAELRPEDKLDIAAGQESGDD